MKSTQSIPSDQQYFLNAVAPSGRSIEPCVFLVAQGIADQAVSYAEKFLGDSCVAVNLLEEAAASVSEVIRAKEAAQIAPIRDVRRYLFRVFLRRAADARRNEITYEEVSQWHSHPRDDSHGDGLDSQILLDQILGHFDSVTREMILCRIEGHSWGEIASEFDLSNHAARVRFSKALSVAANLGRDTAEWWPKINSAKNERILPATRQKGAKSSSIREKARPNVYTSLLPGISSAPEGIESHGIALSDS